LYTKETRPTERETLPAEPENIPGELKVRPHAGEAEQLSLLSTEEMAKLQCPSGNHFPREGEVLSEDSTEARRPRRTEGDAVQLKLPGF
jgi:hypothetical protein